MAVPGLDPGIIPAIHAVVQAKRIPQLNHLVAP
jgi:hypothetical protein